MSGPFLLSDGPVSAVPYDPERALAICERYSAGLPLTRICAAEGMPSRATVFQWLEEQPVFADMLQSAREERAAVIADEIVRIADEARDKEDAAAAKLRIEARRWVVETLLLRASKRTDAAAAAPMNVIIALDHQT